jgi:hypothetical protein
LDFATGAGPEEAFAFAAPFFFAEAFAFTFVEQPLFGGDAFVEDDAFPVPGPGDEGPLPPPNHAPKTPPSKPEDAFFFIVFPVAEPVDSLGVLPLVEEPDFSIM